MTASALKESIYHSEGEGMRTQHYECKLSCCGAIRDTRCSRHEMHSISTSPLNHETHINLRKRLAPQKGIRCANGGCVFLCKPTCFLCHNQCLSGIWSDDVMCGADSIDRWEKLAATAKLETEMR